MSKTTKTAYKKEEQALRVVFHTDQGSVYSSKAFCQAHGYYNMLRLMLREETPTDNPISKELNGWMKEEFYLDFRFGICRECPFTIVQVYTLLQYQATCGRFWL